MRTLDLFVPPFLNEGLSNTILDTMVTGSPVIATYAGGNPELIINYQTCYLVQKQKPEAMAKVFKISG